MPFYKVKAEFTIRASDPETAGRRSMELLNEPGRRRLLSVKVDPEPRHDVRPKEAEVMTVIDSGGGGPNQSTKGSD